MTSSDERTHERSPFRRLQYNVIIFAWGDLIYYYYIAYTMYALFTNAHIILLLLLFVIYIWHIIHGRRSSRQIFREVFCRRRRLRSAMGFCAVDRSALVWGRWAWPRRPDNRSPAHRWADLRSAGIRYWIYRHDTARSPLEPLVYAVHFVLFLSIYFLFVFLTRNDITRFLVDRHVHNIMRIRLACRALYIYIHMIVIQVYEWYTRSSLYAHYIRNNVTHIYIYMYTIIIYAYKYCVVRARCIYRRFCIIAFASHWEALRPPTVSRHIT